ncbi:MAG: hypothetical protein E7612_05950 [Ruminococcaceae bacterium]|nr:hypothetical protein [Oscillospiraceae bacterium]
MKKAIIACILLITILLTSCNGNDNDPSNDGAVIIPPTADLPENDTIPSDKTTEQQKPEEESERLMTVDYVIGSIRATTGVNMSSSSRFRTSDFIKISDIEAVSITGKYMISWFAYSKDYNYLGNGSNTYPALPDAGVWLAVGEDIAMTDILAWNPNTEYVQFVVRRLANDNVFLNTDVANSQIKIYISGYKNDSDKPGLDKVGKVNGNRQDGAVYGEYLFSFNSSGRCNVYSANNFNPVSEFTLDKESLIKPHSNSVCFGTTKYNEDDEFPLLYCNVYNTYKNDRSYDGMCNVYRIARNGTSFESTLVQVIKIGFTDDTQKWSSADGDVRPFGNFVVNTDNNNLYAFTMRDEGRTTRFFSFKLPSLTDGKPDATLGVNIVTLYVDDIIDSFDTEYFNYIQGASYYKDKIYSLEGFTDSETNKAALKIIDLDTKTVKKIDLYGMNLKTEPETVYVFNGVGYYIDVFGNVYKFAIE